MTKFSQIDRIHVFVKGIHHHSSNVLILNIFEPFLGPQRGGGSTEPTTPVKYMDSLRMFKVFFDFIVSISGF